jgi:hypothetical protein
MSLREVVAAWARAHCPREDVQASLLRSLDHAIPKQHMCTFTIGKLLTRSGRPFMVSCFGGELFAFELTDDQAKRLEVEDAMVVHSETLHVQSHRPAAHPVITIEKVVVDAAHELERAQPITGTLHYRSQQMVLRPLVVRVALEHPCRGSVMLYHYVDYHYVDSLYPTQGEIRFRLRALDEYYRPDPKQRPPRQATPLFFQIWTTSQLDPAHGTTPPGHFPVPGTRPGAPSRPVSTRPPWLPPSLPLPIQPMSTTFPPTYDPGPAPHAAHNSPMSTSFPPAFSSSPLASLPDANESPLSDICAVLVEIN